MSYCFRNENRYVAFRLKTPTPKLIEIDSVVSEVEHADKRAAPMQQTTHEIYISTGRCLSGTLLMGTVKWINELKVYSNSSTVRIPLLLNLQYPSRQYTLIITVQFHLVIGQCLSLPDTKTICKTY